MIPRSWRRRWAFLARRRRPIIRLWDAEFNYVATLADGGRETWRQWARRLLAPANGSRQTVELSGWATITVDTAKI